MNKAPRLPGSLHGKGLGVVVLLAAVGVLAACGSSATGTSAANTSNGTAGGTTPTPTAKPSGTATHAAQTGCAANQLTIVPAGSSVGAGNMGRMYRLESHAAQPCTLEGYPAVHLLNRQRDAMTTHTREAQDGYLYTAQAVRQVRLTRGASAYFVLEWTQTPGNGQTCPTASFVRVTPPAASGTLVAAGSVDACGGNVTVSPVQATAFSGFAPGPAPTHVPTHAPTHTPTHTPTHAPTHAPTHVPTHTPTHTPTHAPTLTPTSTVVPPLLPTTPTTTSVPARL